MSKLYKREDSNYYWWTTYYKGHRIRKSTKMAKRRLAKKVQEKWDLKLTLGEISFLSEITNSTDRTSDYFINYLDFLSTRKSENTNLITKGVLNRFQKYLAENNIEYISQINSKNLNNYIDWLDCAPKTKKNHLGILSLMFEHAIDDEIIQKNPAKKAVLPTIEKVVKHRLLEPKDLEIIWKNAGEWKLYYEWLYFTGLRAGDVGMLKYKNIDRKKSAIVSFIRKSRRIHEFPISQYLLDNTPNQKGNKPIFPMVFSGNDRKLNDNLYNPRKNLQDILEEAKRPKATLHSFRVTFNNILRDLGLSIEDRQKLLAHSSSETTKIYTHPNFDLAKKYINQIPEPNNE